MPGGDRTGPMGFGPRTGRAAGLCAGYGFPGYMNPGPGWEFGGGGGRGFGCGMGYGSRGRGRGHRNMFRAAGLPGRARFGAAPGWSGEPYPHPGTMTAPTAKDELDALRQQAEYFERSLGDIRMRIDELDAKARSESDT